MCHIVEIKTEMRDEATVQSACSRLHLPRATRGTFELYSSTETGLGIELPRWKYPVVVTSNDDGQLSGQLKFDNYGGRWGTQEHLDRFMQVYAVEKAKIEARKKGHSVTEQRLDNGSIKLTVNVGGAA